MGYIFAVKRILSVKRKKKVAVWEKINESSCEGAKQTKLFDRLKKRVEKQSRLYPLKWNSNQKECVILLTQRVSFVFN